MTSSLKKAGWLPAVTLTLLGALLLAATAATAGIANAAEAVEGSEAGALSAQPDARLRVGDATSRLLALQRSGDAASAVPRPITGDVAGRSYQRYLKSFEHAIPERSTTSVGGSSSGSAR